MQTIYEISGTYYINLTNRCNNHCDFCIRQNPVGIPGYDLWLEREPSAAELIEELDRLGRPLDTVFCGYGEPALALDVLKEVAAFIHSYGGHVRVNTNGLGSAHWGRDIAPELKGLVDVMSISLNAQSAEKYDAICHSDLGMDAYDAMLRFAARCVEEGIETVLTVVDVIGEDEIAHCREIAAEIGAKLRVRTYSPE